MRRSEISHRPTSAHSQNHRRCCKSTQILKELSIPRPSHCHYCAWLFMETLKTLDERGHTLCKMFQVFQTRLADPPELQMSFWVLVDGLLIIWVGGSVADSWSNFVLLGRFPLLSQLLTGIQGSLYIFLFKYRKCNLCLSRSQS